jgi:hypothetical protein
MASFEEFGRNGTLQYQIVDDNRRYVILNREQAVRLLNWLLVVLALNIEAQQQEPPEQHE